MENEKDDIIKPKTQVVKNDMESKKMKIGEKMEAENNDEDEDYENDFLGGANLDGGEEEKDSFNRQPKDEDGSYEDAFLGDGELENQFVKERENQKNKVVKEGEDQNEDDDEFDF